MSFIIKKKGSTTPLVVKPSPPSLAKMRFDGPLLDRPIQFPDDVAMMRSWLRSAGLLVGDRDCQALWDRLSREYYPFKSDPGSYAWLNAGLLRDIFVQHHREFLVPYDACHSDC